MNSTAPPSSCAAPTIANCGLPARKVQRPCAMASTASGYRMHSARTRSTSGWSGGNLIGCGCPCAYSPAGSAVSSSGRLQRFAFGELAPVRREPRQVDEPQRLHARAAHHVVVRVDVGTHPLHAQPPLQVGLDIAPRGIARLLDELADGLRIGGAHAQLLGDSEVLLLALAQVAHVAIAVVVRAVRVGELAPRALALLAGERGRLLLLRGQGDQGLLRERRELGGIERLVVRDRLDQDVVAHGQARSRGCDRDTLGDGIRGLPHPRTSPDIEGTVRACRACRRAMTPRRNDERPVLASTGRSGVTGSDVPQIPLVRNFWTSPHSNGSRRRDRRR